MIHAIALNAKTPTPRRVTNVAKITFRPAAKNDVNVLLNAKLRFDFSVGPPVKTGGFPRPYGGRGGAGVARPKKCFRPLGEARSRAKIAGFAVDSSGRESQGVSP